MKKITILFAMIFVSSFIYAQKTGTRSLGSFSEVSVGESVQLVLVKGSSEKAEIEVSGADLDDVETKISGDRLTVGMANGSYKNVRVKVTLTYNSIEALSVSSSAKAVAKDQIKSNRFRLSVSSSGRAEVNIAASDLTVKVSSSGDAVLNGQGDNLDVSVSSSGFVGGYDYKVKNVEASVNSSGKAEVFVTDELNARANSSGKVYYKGSPSKTNVSANSSGKVVKA